MSARRTHMRTRLHASLRATTWLVMFALLATRAADAHWHVCFDGQEPPAGAHVADAGLHNDADHAGKKHNDKDIQFLGISIAKQDLASADVLAVATAAESLFNSYVVPDNLPDCERVAPLTRPPPHLRPPLRGPPA